MFKQPSLYAIIAGAVFLAGLACGGGTSPTATSEVPSSSPQPPTPAPAATPAVSAPSQTSSGQTSTQPGGMADVTVNLNDSGARGPFSFSPADMNFEVGETVNFRLVSEATFHTFTVNDLSIDESVDRGDTVTFTYTFDKPGTYKLICIPHQSLGMVGTITIR